MIKNNEENFNNLNISMNNLVADMKWMKIVFTEDKIGQINWISEYIEDMDEEM